MTETPRFDDMIEFDDYSKIGFIVNNPNDTKNERQVELKKLTKPEGFYKKKTVEQFVEVSYGEEFMLCII